MINRFNAPLFHSFVLGRVGLNTSNFLEQNPPTSVVVGVIFEEKELYGYANDHKECSVIKSVIWKTTDMRQILKETNDEFRARFIKKSENSVFH